VSVHAELELPMLVEPYRSSLALPTRLTAVSIVQQCHRKSPLGKELSRRHGRIVQQGFHGRKDNTERPICQTNRLDNLDVTFSGVLLYPIMVRSSKYHPYQ